MSTGYVHELIDENVNNRTKKVVGYLYYIIEEETIYLKLPVLFKPIPIMRNVDISLYNKVLVELLPDKPTQNMLQWWERNDEGWDVFINSGVYMEKTSLVKHLIKLRSGCSTYTIIFDRVIPFDHFQDSDRDLKINLEKE